MAVLGFDPGRDKCGLAVLDANSVPLYHQVVSSDEVIPTIAALSRHFPLERIVMGNLTTSKQWQKRLKEELGLSIPLELVDETNTTLEARSRYWQMYPPGGLVRLIPPGLRIPPRPIDDIVAIILVERYYHKMSSGIKP
ncbi:MAG: pre-16S rRNA-processing nuclease YqgF [Geminocystis sp.]|nr:pre-16S rRNA-processing nuclease YqgF [Geminocystis sp.]MCS7148943.1 pre-16S rRNA-processing nuclease YqgF [Geminocystis sp.]MDW8117210.1 pre-16S rRNA-processing nuclease YqgF [Geminocystis sp.]MDW8462363.1 pre-16S rRNA-processing nuclease YqgF [Geminocystis sp.]